MSDHETCGNSINRCIPVAVWISGSHITMTMAAIVQAIYHRTKLVALLAPHFCARKTLFSSAISTWICNLQCRGGLSKALQFSASQEFDLPLEYPYGNLSSPNTCATENVLCSGEKKNNKKQNFSASPMENNFSSCFTIQFIYMFLLTYNRVYAFFMLYLCLIHLVRDAKNSFVLIRNSLTDMFEMFVGGELASTIGWVIDKIGSMTKYFIYFATYLNFTSLTTSVGDFDCL